MKRESERMKDERDRLQSQLDEMQADDTITDISVDDVNKTQGDHTSTQQESHIGLSEEENDVDEDNEEQSTNESEEEATKESEEPTIDNTEGDMTETVTTSNNQSIYNFKDITMEVIEQMKADIIKVKNFLIPERLQKQIQPILEKHVMPVVKTFTEQHLKPAVKTIVSVAKDMSFSVVDLVKRHATAFMNKNGGQEKSSSITSN